MKYESTILKRLIDTYGVVGNPRYISEIIKEFIVQGKECYPNLFTYQSDWLAHIDEFGLNPSYTVSYTGQSFYAPNTLEKPVKSAILTGQTLVNLMTNCKDEYVVRYHDINNPNNIVANISMMKPNTEYTLFYKAKYRTEGDGSGIVGSLKIATSIEQDFITTGQSYTTEYMKYVYRFTTSSVVDCFVFSSNGKYFAIKECVLLEGDYTQEDIPYFEGMTSVKMPVLTTSNEDGTKTNILTVNEDVELRGIGKVQDELNLLTGELTQRIGEVVLDGSEVWSEWRENDNSYGFALRNYNIDFKPSTIPLCNCLVGAKYFDLADGKINGSIALYTGNSTTSYSIFIRLLKTECTGLKDFKTKLQTNPITVQYQLANKSIKTVDLTILDQNGQSVKQPMSFNGGTHFNTGSLEGSLLPTLEVSVETDLEETLAVCSLDGNTM